MKRNALVPSPGAPDAAPRPGRLFWLTCFLAALGASASPARADLNAAFSAATDVPVTAASYTATGTASFTLNYAPTPGTTLTVVENTGLGFIQGTFSNLANGAPVDFSFGGVTYHFVAWYYGGEGNNDLVLLWRDTGLAGWGFNGYGQIADPPGFPLKVPTQADQTGVLAGKTIVQVATGYGHSLALCTDGTVAAWGSNNEGQLGDLSTTNRSRPVLVNTTSGTSFLFGKTVIAIATGFEHSLALCSDGTVAVWGANRWYDLGVGEATFSRVVPVQLSTASFLFGKTVVAITGNMALCSDGTVAQWGLVGGGGWFYPTAVSTASGSSALFGKTVKAIAESFSHRMALCTDGTLVTWGDNSRGQLGDNSQTNRVHPVVVNTDSGISALFGKTVVAIAAGGRYCLALCSDGTLAAWGGNSYGELGDDSTINRSVPTVVNQTGVLAGQTVVAIAAGGSHSLALCSDGTLAAWGWNGEGQIGDNSTIDRSVPVLVNTAPGVSALAQNRVIRAASGESSSHNLAIFATSPEITVEQPLGNALTDGSSTVDFGTAVFAGAAMDRTFTVSNTGSAALTNLSLSIDGANASDFTLASAVLHDLAPGASLTFTVRFLANAAGSRNAALHLQSTDADEGSFDIYLTGTGVAPSALNATYTTGAEIPLTVNGLNASGTTVNFILNYAPTPGTTLTVVRTTGLGFIQGTFNGLPNGAAVDLSFGGITYHFIAWYYGGPRGNDFVLLWRDTGISGWGYNLDGQLGDGTQVTRLAPTSVVQSGVLAGKTIVQVARSGLRALALCSDGTLAAWGYNLLGDGSNTRQLSPVLVDRSGVLAGKTIVSIAAGGGHSLALFSDGTLVAWGGNFYGQLGDNSTTQSLVPVAVNSLGVLAGKTVVAVAAGESHSLALCSDGTVVAWGSNTYGQVGIGTSAYQAKLPVLVDRSGALAAKTVVAISCGGFHSVALCSDGSVATWGNNGRGQLGLVYSQPPGDRHYVPQSVFTGWSQLAGRSVVAIAAGYTHTLALCSDGALTAWGSNDGGELGDGTNDQRNYAVRVNASIGSALNGRTVKAISAMGGQSFALCTNDTIAAWGYNAFGDNTSNASNIPVAVNTAPGISSLAGYKAIAISTGAGFVIHNTTPEISVEQPASNVLTDAASAIDFGNAPVMGSSNTRTFTVRNLGAVALSNLAISFDGANASDFSVSVSPPSSVAPLSSGTFTIHFQPGSTGARTATLHLANNDNDENPFDITLTGNGIPGAHVRLGDAVNLDLSSVTLAPGETLKVLGLPPGLVFNAGPPPTITGTVLGLAPAGGTTIQVLNGRSLVRSIPVEMVIDFYPPAGSYEVLLENAGAPVGKLHVSITNPSTKVANPAYSATLESLGEPRRTAKGSVVVGASPLTVSVIFPAFLTFPSVTYELILTHGSDTITGATFPASAVTARGFRLARPVRVPGGNPPLTLALPPATPGDRVTTPGGTGFATGTVTSKALVNLAGQLGDAQAFKAGLNLSQTNQAVVWLTPYKNKTSYLGGIIDIGDLGTPDRANSPDSATPSLQWMRQPDATATSYPAGFGPLSLGATPSRWVKVARADALADTLGLGMGRFGARWIDVAFVAPTADILPDRLSLRDNFNLLRITPDDAVPITAKSVGGNGSFTGNLTLPAPAAKSAITGVLLQDNVFGTLIGQGIVKIPILGGVKGSFQTAGIELKRPANLSRSFDAMIGSVWSSDQVAGGDLSRYLLAPGETLKVIGLPKGLVFSAGPPPTISGTVLGPVGPAGITVQVFNGKTLARTYVYDFDTVPYRLAASYEVLLEDAGLPAGKLRFNGTGPGPLSSDAAFSATLERLGEPRRSTKGSFTDSNQYQQTVRVVFPAFKTYPAVTYDIVFGNAWLIDSCTTVPPSTVTGRGFRLARAARIPAGNPLLTMSFPPTSPGDRLTTPGGIGYASGSVTAAGLVPLSGMLGDGQAFKATLSLSSTNQAIVWITPHKNKASYLGGIIDLGDLGAVDRGAPDLFATTGLKWHRLADSTEPSYPGGFGPLDLNASTSRWFKPANAEALAASLGLDFRVIHPTYIAPTTDILPGRLSLRDNFTLLRIAPTDAVPFTGKALGTNGTFGGNLTLPVPAARSAVSGVFLQEESFGQLIGQGVVKIPVVGPVNGSFQTMGVELRN